VIQLDYYLRCRYACRGESRGHRARLFVAAISERAMEKDGDTHISEKSLAAPRSLLCCCCCCCRRWPRVSRMQAAIGNRSRSEPALFQFSQSVLARARTSLVFSALARRPRRAGCKNSTATTRTTTTSVLPAVTEASAKNDIGDISLLAASSIAKRRQVNIVLAASLSAAHDRARERERERGKKTARDRNVSYYFFYRECVPFGVAVRFPSLCSRSRSRKSETPAASNRSRRLT